MSIIQQTPQCPRTITTHISGQTVAIVRSQRHLDIVVHIEPFRMVLHGLGDERSSGHERERAIKIVKLEATLDSIPSIVGSRPSWQQILGPNPLPLRIIQQR